MKAQLEEIFSSIKHSLVANWTRKYNEDEKFKVKKGNQHQ
jgi:hypothetical protein